MIGKLKFTSFLKGFIILIPLFILFITSAFVSEASSDPLNLTKPIKDTVWFHNDIVTVKWEDNTGFDYQIHLYKNGQFYKNILSEISYSQGDKEISFYVPNTFEADTGYQVKMYNQFRPDLYAFSEKFEITDSIYFDFIHPTSNSGLIADQLNAIKWKSNYDQKVKVTLLHNGEYFKTISDSILNIYGSENAVNFYPQGNQYPPSNQYQVEFRSITDTTIYGKSDFFSM